MGWDRMERRLIAIKKLILLSSPATIQYNTIIPSISHDLIFVFIYFYYFIMG